MTKSTITRERAQQIFLGNGPEPSASEERELARMALSAMDGELVAEVYQAPNVGICAALGPSIRMLCPLEPGTKLYRHAQPALVIPDEMTAEQAYEIGYYYGEPVNVFARGANWMRQHIIDSTLAAAPQSPGSEPATVPGKWIPVSERMPESNGVYFGWDGKRVLEVNCFFGGFSANQFIHGEITHWMPLPAAPQEVKDE
ncbi:DUF551 domain-containing protein [Klebsiella pneumoniae]|uniref:DUF551 domain-containing protein n=1 Tax=Klebsiella pneumoniae TaxID=573 RepID=UPI0035BEE800|nr:DUF551 domain-containing protein [Klebsiella pneumoniae]